MVLSRVRFEFVYQYQYGSVKRCYIGRSNASDRSVKRTQWYVKRTGNRQVRRYSKSVEFGDD